jgi:hypothetical protein
MRPPLVARAFAQARHHAGTLALGLVLACAAAPAAEWLRARFVRAPVHASWESLLPAARVGRLRVALVVDARDCPATLALVELLARPELAGAIDGVTLLVRDGQDSLARYADARLTGAVQVAVVPVPTARRSAVRSLGKGPRLLLVDAGGRVTWAARVDADAAGAPTFFPTLVQVARHHLATELATTNTAGVNAAAPDTGPRADASPSGAIITAFTAPDDRRR